MRPAQVPVVGAVAASTPIVLDYRSGNPLVSVQVVVTGTNTSTVQVTDDDVFSGTWDTATANWVSCPTASLVGLTATQTATMSGLFTAVRLNMTAWTSGGATLKVVPGSSQGG